MKQNMLIPALSFVAGFIVFALVSASADAVNSPRTFLGEVFSAIVHMIAIYLGGMLVALTFYVLLKGAR